MERRGGERARRDREKLQVYTSFRLLTTLLFSATPGLLPFALPFQAADTVFSTLDFVSLVRGQAQYAKMLLYELVVNRKL